MEAIKRVEPNQALNFPSTMAAKIASFTSERAAALVSTVAEAVPQSLLLAMLNHGINHMLTLFMCLPGSVAATVQSGIGSVASPSIFATLTSAGAGGYGVTAVVSGVQAVGGTIVASAGGLAAWMSSKAAGRS